MLKKVISGGQTGADVTALIQAKALGLETGGTAPKGWKIDGGNNVALKHYGLVESSSADYAVRTKDNVRDSDATVWIGKTGSPGYWCTFNAAKKLGKKFYINPIKEELAGIVTNYETLNFAGNRDRIYPAVVGMVIDTFQTIKEILERHAK